MFESKRARHLVITTSWKKQARAQHTAYQRSQPAPRAVPGRRTARAPSGAPPQYCTRNNTGISDHERNWTMIAANRNNDSHEQRTKTSWSEIRSNPNTAEQNWNHSREKRSRKRLWRNKSTRTACNRTITHRRNATRSNKSGTPRRDCTTRKQSPTVQLRYVRKRLQNKTLGWMNIAKQNSKTKTHLWTIRMQQIKHKHGVRRKTTRDKPIPQLLTNAVNMIAVNRNDMTQKQNYNWLRSTCHKRITETRLRQTETMTHKSNQLKHYEQ